MSIHIYEALVDIEQRLQEVLTDVRTVKEQAFYTYEATSTGSNDEPNDVNNQ